MKPPKEHEEAEGYAAGGRKKRKRRAGGGTASGFMAENRLDKRPRRNLGGGGLPGAGSAMMAPQGAAGLGGAPGLANRPPMPPQAMGGLGGAPPIGGIGAPPAAPPMAPPGLAAPTPAMPAMPPQGAAGLGNAPAMPPQAMGQRPFRRGGRTKQDPKIAEEASEEGESYAHEAAEQKGMRSGGRLTAHDRQSLPKSDFGLPGKGAGPKGAGAGSYPVPDESHARNALARVSQHGSTSEKAAVRRKVHAKYPGIHVSGE